MKLCWLLAVLTLALCEGNDTITHDKISTTRATPRQELSGIEQPQDPGIGNKQFIKREIDYKDINEDEAHFDGVNEFNKRTKFSSWAGKRNSDDSKENKRAKFSSWAGKRAPEKDVDPPAYSKKIKLPSWEIKGDDVHELANKKLSLENILAGYSQDISEGPDGEDEEMNQQKRGKFSSWGGKRNENNHENKRKFSSWSGKRNQENSVELNSNFPSRFWMDTTNDNTRDLELKRNLAEKLLLTAKGINSNDENDDDSKVILQQNTGLINWPTDQEHLKKDKRNQFSSWGGKRKFSSWGGKRSDVFEQDLDMNNGYPSSEKRTKFSSWAGKRTWLPSLWKGKFQGKRGKFSSWAGKRSDDAGYNHQEQAMFNTPLYYTESKRAMELSDSNNDPAEKILSWAGKPFGSEDEYLNKEKRDAYLVGLKKKLKGRGFSSWGGKRSDDTLGTNNNDGDGTFVSNNEDPSHLNSIKRAMTFSSWPAKRSQDLEEEKRKFSSWGGKRSGLLEEGTRKFSSWGGKRDYSELIEEPNRRKFSSWAGKRSVSPKDGPDLDKRREWRRNDLLRRYNRFNSWRGKKDSSTPPNATGQTTLNDVNFYQSDNSLRTNKSKRAIGGYLRKLDLIKRHPLLRAWIGRSYQDIPLMTWKRKQAFSSWGGKRSYPGEVRSELGDTDNSFKGEDPAKFLTWEGSTWHDIGKRSTRSSAAKLLKKLNPDKKDPRVSTILGTRTMESQFYLRSSPEIRPMRRQFYAWGGKRASKI